MKNLIRCMLAAGTFVTVLPAQAGCPTLTSHELGEILTPLKGLVPHTPQSADSVTYQRERNISGALKNAWSSFSKKGNDDGKTYDGVEVPNSMVAGKLVCEYKLPADWKEHAGINELKLTAEIKQPISKTLAQCPALQFSDVSNLQCHGKLEHSNMWSYPIHKKGGLEGVCQLGRGIWNKLSEVESTDPIHGQYNNAETKAFSHKCKYTYHILNSSQDLILDGKMDLASLRGINARNVR